MDKHYCLQSNDTVVEKLELEIEMELLDLDDPTENSSNSFLLASKEGNSSFSSEVVKPTSTNRRYSLRPKKRLSYEIEEEDGADDIPPSPKKACTTPRKNFSLETIFEVPENGKNGSVIVLGKAKLKRFISFNDFVTKAKLKHRKVKVKKLNSGKFKSKKARKPKITLEDVKLKLRALEEPSNDEEWMDVQV